MATSAGKLRRLNLNASVDRRVTIQTRINNKVAQRTMIWEKGLVDGEEVMSFILCDSRLRQYSECTAIDVQVPNHDYFLLSFDPINQEMKCSWLKEIGSKRSKKENAPMSLRYFRCMQ